MGKNTVYEEYLDYLDSFLFLSFEEQCESTILNFEDWKKERKNDECKE